jgi:hypothetical protein
VVKVGFICEGDVEKLLIESEKFQFLLKKLNILCIHPVINATGKDNLLPHRMIEHRESLKNKGAEIVIILTDLDDNASFTLTKDRIKPLETEIVVISVKQIESWFLADSETMGIFCKQKIFFEFPENEIIPYEKIRKELEKFTGRGYGRNAKLRFANSFIRSGFTIENAAKHPNCPSAAYFLNKLTNIKNNK